MSDKIKFEVLIYGEGGGVMSEWVEEGYSADDVAKSVRERWKHVAQAKRVGVWAQDRKSGASQVVV